MAILQLDFDRHRVRPDRPHPSALAFGHIEEVLAGFEIRAATAVFKGGPHDAL